jgi:hypothetical protein
LEKPFRMDDLAGIVRAELEGGSRL